MFVDSVHGDFSFVYSYKIVVLTAFAILTYERVLLYLLLLSCTHRYIVLYQIVLM